MGSQRVSTKIQHELELSWNLQRVGTKIQHIARYGQKTNQGKAKHFCRELDTARSEFREQLSHFPAV